MQGENTTSGPRMTRAASSIGKRDLGRRLRQRRDSLGLTLDHVAESVGCQRMRIHRIEQGKWSRMYISEFRALLTALQVTEDEEVEIFVRRWQAAKQTGWWREFADVVQESYVGFEAEADVISNLEHTHIPGLLQSEEYIRAQAYRRDSFERYVEARLRRQRAIFEKDDPPNMTFVMYEYALVSAQALGVGVPQATTILDRIDSCAHLTLHVVPLHAPPSLALYGRSFVILDFPNTDLSVLYSEWGIQPDYVEDPETVHRYRHGFALACGAALTPAESRQLVEKYTR